MSLRAAPFVLVALAVPATARADDGQVWISAGASGAIAGPVRLSIDTTARFGERDGGGLYESENVVMLGYRPRDGVTLAAGYVRNIAYRGGGATIEQRLRQDLTFDRIARIGPVTVAGRLRIEERWRESALGMAIRARPFVRLSLPLSKGGVQVIASHESFVNLGAGAGQRGGHDRTRDYAGVSLPLGAKLRLDAGYLRQWTRGAGRIGAATLGLNFRW